MAHFYGTTKGTRGDASRCGSKSSGLESVAAGWGGAVRTHVWHDEATGKDMYRVELTPWMNSGGGRRVLAQGVLDASE